MAKALYREYRPKTFDQVLGQDRVVNVLKNQVKNNNFSHAYIFAGERGCGKTTCAKIFAKAINCLNPKDGSPCLECENCKAIDEETTIDIIEMDAASNRRIDDIRNLKDNVIYPPNKLKYKVYIIDEAHMITREAFNALLKIMEEPPSHLVFILATTEIDKIPNTILSRAQNFEFNKIDSSKIKEQINIILRDKKIKIENEAIDLIIRKAKGAMRDALSILDQVISYNNEEFTVSDVENLLGVVDFYAVDKLTSAIFAYEQKEALSYIFSLRANNKSNKDILDSLTFYLRDIMIYKMSGDESIFENEERADFIRKKSSEIEIDRLLDMLDILNDYANKLRTSDNTDLIIELMIVRLINFKDVKSLDSRLRSLERNNSEDIVGIINKLVDKKLQSLDINKLVEINSKQELQNSSSIGSEGDFVKKTRDTEFKESIDSTNDLKVVDTKVFENQQADDMSREETKISLPNNLVEDVKEVIINIAGRMLKQMFESDGFYYIYTPGEFTLYLKDGFYGIFIQTKTEEIGKALGKIFDREIVFSLEDYSKFDGEYQKKNLELSSDNKYVKEIPEKEEILTDSVTKVEEVTEDEATSIDFGSSLLRLKEIFGAELIVK
ncbi:DNA polymerase III subunit gamma/tau [uncultured Anaerococcus sp.]|uniref:DNA polymerase III subunit gamma/tau n=1 Tax=uncultured Anaerococcus sp. TaxID=293428 RepID=UPI0026289ACC|nr:DNA polymerase III subunit gamma/tau [uncultured Anaerococcus sp.]